MKQHSRDRRVLLTALFLGALTLLAFARVLNSDFTNYDDDRYVTTNQTVQQGLTVNGAAWAFSTMSQANWHPLTWISCMTDFSVYGLNARGFHLTNLLLHMASVLLLFLVLRRMTGEVWKSGFVAALFAIHPLHVESVAWIAERKDVLSGLFWMLTMWAYIRYVERPGVGRHLAVLGFYVLGLMSKPMLVTLPFVLLLLDYWPLGRFRAGRPLWKLIPEKLPLLACAAASSVITYIAQSGATALTSLERLPLGVRVANASVAYVAYIGKMIWPRGLAVFYPHPRTSLPTWEVIASGLLLICLTALALRAARKSPYLSVGWLWYLGTLVPVIGLVQVGDQAMADRYTYLPMIGLFVMVSWGIPEIMQRFNARGRAGHPHTPTLPHSHTLTVAAVITVAVLSSLTWIQTGYWKNNEVLYRHAIAVTRDNFVACHNLAQYATRRGDFREAEELLRRVIALTNNNAVAYHDLALNIFAQGRPQEAEELVRHALAITPENASMHTGLGLVLSAQGQYDEGILEAREAIRLEPKSGGFHYNLGNILAAAGKLDEATPEYIEALDLDPELSQAQAALDAVEREREFVRRAELVCRDVLKREPRSAAAHYNLAVALNRGGRLHEAEREYREAIRFDPRDGPAHKNLAVILFRRGDYAAAWNEVHISRKLGSIPHPDFISSLAKLMPDPGQ